MTLANQEAAQSTTFFIGLQNSVDIDLRDPRGKHHNLAFVLLGVTIGLLRKRDGVLSSVHRSMVNMHSQICKALNIDNQLVISRSHLPILLKHVCVETLGKLIFTHFGIELTAKEKAWFAIDGKELRGTILTGDKRGEAIVLAVRHEDRSVYSQGYYNGSKSSEQPVVRQLLEDNNLASQQLTMDALHFNPTTLNMITAQGGSYIIGLKGNQGEIQGDMEQLFRITRSKYEFYGEETGHGRKETRKYCCVDVRGEYFDKRWTKTKFATAIMVTRTRYIKATNKFSSEVSYYMSNEIVTNLEQAQILYQAIRKHWSVETNNHVRDVSFMEDALQTKFKHVAQPISLIRTLIINALQKQKIKNIVQKLEEFMDDFNSLIDFLKKINFL
jgi:predicted transposase YbfD/YdcC